MAMHLYVCPPASFIFWTTEWTSVKYSVGGLQLQVPDKVNVGWYESSVNITLHET
jgi:hypothetical protein